MMVSCPNPHRGTIGASVRIAVIDSHTGGEPTRVVVAGGPDLGGGRMAGRLAAFRERFDHFRSAVVNEPRGSDVLVGALLCEPADPACAAGVIFFNNVGYLGMCGHGTIGVAVDAGPPRPHRRRARTGSRRPSASSPFELRRRATASRSRTCRATATPQGRRGRGAGHRPVTGDVAWGGNWFFLVGDHGQALDAGQRRAADRLHLAHPPGAGRAGHHRRRRRRRSTTSSCSARRATRRTDSRNFVLCPGKAYDRSPCGTGTSAKLACLAADGKLRRARSGGRRASSAASSRARSGVDDGRVIPRITGTAYVTAEATLLLDPRDPFRMGIRA